MLLFRLSETWSTSAKTLSPILLGKRFICCTQFGLAESCSFPAYERKHCQHSNNCAQKKHCTTVVTVAHHAEFDSSWHSLWFRLLKASAETFAHTDRTTQLFFFSNNTKRVTVWIKKTMKTHCVFDIRKDKHRYLSTSIFCLARFRQLKWTCCAHSAIFCDQKYHQN